MCKVLGLLLGIASFMSQAQDVRPSLESAEKAKNDAAIAQLLKLDVYRRLNLGSPTEEKTAIKTSWLFPTMYWRLTADNKNVTINDESLFSTLLDGKRIPLTFGFNNVLSNVLEQSFGSDYPIDNSEFEKWKNTLKKPIDLHYAAEQNNGGNSPRVKVKLNVDGENFETQLKKYFKALKMYEEATSKLEILDIDLKNPVTAQENNKEFTQALNSYLYSSIELSNPGLSLADLGTLYDFLANRENASAEEGLLSNRGERTKVIPKTAPRAKHSRNP